MDSSLLMGKDILSNNIEPIVTFSDRSFITDKGRYNSVQDTKWREDRRTWLCRKNELNCLSKI